MDVCDYLWMLYWYLCIFYGHIYGHIVYIYGYTICINWYIMYIFMAILYYIYLLYGYLIVLLLLFCDSIVPTLLPLLERKKKTLGDGSNEGLGGRRHHQSTQNGETRRFGWGRSPRAAGWPSFDAPHEPGRVRA